MASANIGKHPAIKNFLIIKKSLSRRQLTAESGLSGPADQLHESALRTFPSLKVLFGFLYNKEIRKTHSNTGFGVTISRLRVFPVPPPSNPIPDVKLTTATELPTSLLYKRI